MANPVSTRRLGFRLLWIVLALVVMIALLLPLHPGPGRIPAPDVLLMMTFAGVLRRPEYIHVGFVAVAFLLADFLFMRPPGLWAALVVIATEYLRARETGWRDMPFLFEWGVVSAVTVVLALVYSVLLAIFFVDRPGIGLTLLHLAITLAAYPLVVLLTASFFGLRKSAPGEVDQLGHRQ